MSVGENCSIGASVVFGTEPFLIKIGDNVQLTADVRFVTHDGGIWLFKDEHPEWDMIRPISIGSNVYIGIRTIIMPGVTIGDNVVVGAGSIVTKDIPAGSIAVGAPAKVIKSVDEYEEKLEKNALSIKHLSHAEKVEFLKKHFSDE